MSGFNTLAGWGFGELKDSIGKPEAPDPKMLIAEQAKANRVDVNNPFGNITYSQTPDGRWVQNASYSPQLQGIFNEYLKTAGGGPTGMADPYAKAYYSQAMDIMGPQLDQERTKAMQNLHYRGLPVGSSLNTAISDALVRQQLMQKQKLAFDAIQGGEALKQANYARLAQAISGLPQQNIPQLDVMGPYNAQYQGQMNTYNQKMGMINNLLGGAGQLGSAAIMAG